MTVFARRPKLRWLVPLLAVVLLTGGGTAVTALTATARDSLPPRSAAQLLVDVQNARLHGLSGTVVQNADLGLPSLPGAGGSGSSNLTSLVAGSHTLRLWAADQNHVRLALLGTLSESDVIRNGNDLWTWSSTDKSATHRTLPDHGAGTGGADGPSTGPGTAAPLTPQQAADKALAAISPSTAVSTDGTAVVAGRSAYELVLQPRDSGTLVDSVRIAIDGATHVPLRVQVFARGVSQPAFEVGFTSFDPSAPPPSTFDFNPPPGTTVTESSIPGTPATGHGGHQPGGASATRPKVVGSGWTAVVVTTLPADATSGSGTLSTLLATLPTVSGTWGSGHILQGTLFTALLTTDHRLVIGAVPPQRLYDALAAS